MCRDSKTRIPAHLSVEDGEDEISDSIATQLAIGAGFFALNPELIHVKTYIDDGYSGLDFDRPDFQNMMDDLRTGLINCVVVKDVSRARRVLTRCRQYPIWFPARCS